MLTSHAVQQYVWNEFCLTEVIYLAACFAYTQWLFVLW